MLASIISSLVVAVAAVSFTGAALNFAIDVTKKAGSVAHHYYEEAVDYIDGE